MRTHNPEVQTPVPCENQKIRHGKHVGLTVVDIKVVAHGSLVSVPWVGRPPSIGPRPFERGYYEPVQI